VKEYGYLFATVIAIFAITLTGAIYSPTFEEQKGFLELFFLMGSLLFIFSALVIFATIGFRSFAIYGALFLAAVMGIYGIEGAVLVAVMTYLVWGFVYAMQFLLLQFGVKNAAVWFEKRYDYKSFKYEYYLFYPMLWAGYLFLEIIPDILLRERIKPFNPRRVLEGMKEILS
jgi:hypothetical protein